MFISSLQRAFAHKPEIAKTTPQSQQQEPSVFFHQRQVDIPDLDKKIADFLPQNEALELRLVSQKLKKNLDSFDGKSRIGGLRRSLTRTRLSCIDHTILTPHSSFIAHLHKLCVSISNLETGERFHLEADDWGKDESFYPERGEFTFDGKFFVRCGARTKVWDIATQKRTEDLHIHYEHESSNTLFVIERNPDYEAMQLIKFSHRVFISRPHHNSTDIYDLESKTKIQTLRTDRTAFIRYALAISNNRIVTFSQDQRIKVWDLQEGIVIQSIPWIDRHSPISIQITSDESLLVACSRSGFVKIIDMNKGEELHTLIANTDGRLISSVIVPDSKIALTFCKADSKIKGWNLLTGKELLTFSEHKHPITFVMSTSDGRIVSCSKEGEIKVWDWKTGKVLHILAKDATATLKQATITSSDLLVAQFNLRDEQDYLDNYSELIITWDLKKTALGSD